MSLVIQHLVWDSNFFGFPVTRLECNRTRRSALAQVINSCLVSGVRLVYLFVHPDDKESVLAAHFVGAKLVDRKVTYVMSLLSSTLNLITTPASIVLTNQLTSRLESLAWQSGEYSRFRLDTSFSNELFKRLYSQWLLNSLNGTIAQAVLVFQQDKNEIGLLTLGEKNGRADIGLLAVDKMARGQQVGQQLIHEAQRIAVSKNYSELQVVTQLDNLIACRFYEKYGFKLTHEEHIYHLWLR